MAGNFVRFVGNNGESEQMGLSMEQGAHIKELGIVLLNIPTAVLSRQGSVD